MVQILNHRQITHKLHRLAIQIAEQNWEAPEIVFAGINNAGIRLANLVGDAFHEYAPAVNLIITNLRINAANPLADVPNIDLPSSELVGKTVVIFDDVANTGRTLFYAFKPLMSVLPAKIQLAVLVDRKHKLYPVHVDYVGLSLATTLHEHIEVDLSEGRPYTVLLN